MLDRYDESSLLIARFPKDRLTISAGQKRLSLFFAEYYLKVRVLFGLKTESVTSGLERVKNQLLHFFEQIAPENREQKLNLQDMVCEAISRVIVEAEVELDQKLPSCRELAATLGVSRNTVNAAYMQLIDAGLIESRERSGYFICPSSTRSSPLAERSSIEAQTSTLSIDLIDPNLSTLDSPVDWQDFAYPFTYNQIDPLLFPLDSWRECARTVLGRKHTLDWIRDSIDTDSGHLISQIRKRLLTSRGILAAEHEIMITTGSQGGLAILAAVFAKKPGRVAIENPGYFGARDAFQLFGNTMVGVPVDEKGLDASAIPTDAKLIFSTPAHQFPTMVTMTVSRRHELLERAKAHNFFIIEDDYEAEMNFFKHSVPTLRSLDPERVIYLGSFSKTISPGLRVGFMVAHPSIIQAARQARAAMYRHAPLFLQEVIALFIRKGYFEAHLRNLEKSYKTRWTLTHQAIQKHLGFLKVSSTQGGTSFWLEGPLSLNAMELKAKLRARSVLIDSGDNYYLERTHNSGFRLGFAFVPIDKIEEGIRIISEEIDRLLS